MTSFVVPQIRACGNVESSALSISAAEKPSSLPLSSTASSPQPTLPDSAMARTSATNEGSLLAKLRRGFSQLFKSAPFITPRSGPPRTPSSQTLIPQFRYTDAGFKRPGATDEVFDMSEAQQAGLEFGSLVMGTLVESGDTGYAYQVAALGREGRMRMGRGTNAGGSEGGEQ